VSEPLEAHDKMRESKYALSTKIRKDEFRLYDNQKLLFLRAARLEKTSSSILRSSVSTETEILLNENRSKLNDNKDGVKRNKVLQKYLAQFDTMERSFYVENILSSAHGDMMRVTENAIHERRLLAERLDMHLRTLSTNGEKEMMLMKCFLKDLLPTSYQPIICTYLFSKEERRQLFDVPFSDKYLQWWVDHGISIVSLIALTAHFVLLSHFTISFDQKLISTDSAVLWTIVMVLSLAEYYLLIEAIAILIKNVIVIHYFIGGIFYERLNMMSKSTKLIFIRRCGLMKDAHALVQHFNPACRVARLYPTLPISRLLISINDVDVRPLTIPQSWAWKHVVTTICYMPFVHLSFKVGEFIMLFAILVLWNVIIFCFCILGEINFILSIVLASVMIGCPLTGSLYMLCFDERKAQEVNKVIPILRSSKYNGKIDFYSEDHFDEDDGDDEDENVVDVDIDLLDETFFDNSIETEQLRIKKEPLVPKILNTVCIQDDTIDNILSSQISLKHSELEYKRDNNYDNDDKKTTSNSNFIIKPNFQRNRNQSNAKLPLANFNTNINNNSNNHNNNNNDVNNYYYSDKNNNNSVKKTILPSIQSNNRMFSNDSKEEIKIKSYNIENKIIPSDDDFKIKTSPDFMINSQILDNDNYDYINDDYNNNDYFQFKNGTKFDQRGDEVRPNSAQHFNANKSRFSRMRPISSSPLYNEDKFRSTAVQREMNEMRSTSAQPKNINNYGMNNNRYQSTHRQRNNAFGIMKTVRDMKVQKKNMNYSSTNHSHQYSGSHQNHQQQYKDEQSHMPPELKDPILTSNISYSRRRMERTEINSNDKGPGFRDQHIDSHPFEAMFTNMMKEQDNTTRRLNDNIIHNNHTMDNDNYDLSNPLDYILVNMIMEQDNVTKRLNDNIIVKTRLHNNDKDNYYYNSRDNNNDELYTPMTSTELNAYNGKRNRIRTRYKQ
jgi:hypothetical protein